MKSMEKICKRNSISVLCVAGDLSEKVDHMENFLDVLITALKDVDIQEIFIEVKL